MYVLTVGCMCCMYICLTRQWQGLAIKADHLSSWQILSPKNLAFSSIVLTYRWKCTYGGQFIHFAY